MMKYMEPEMECVKFAAEDIIGTSSYPGEGETDPLPTIDPDEGAIV